MIRSLGGYLRLAFGAVLGLMLVVDLVGTLAVSAVTDRLERDADKVTPEVSYNDALLQSMTDAETGLRGYGLSGERVFLGPYRRAIDGLPAQRSQLLAAIAGDAAGTALAEEQDVAVNAWLEGYANPRLRREAGRYYPALLARGEQLFDNIREANRVLNVHLEGRLTDLRADAARSKTYVVAGTIGLTLLAGLIAVWVSVWASRRVRRPLRQLRDVLTRLANGDHDARCRPQGPIEVTQIADSVNRLADESARLRTLEGEERALQDRLLGYQRALRESLEADEVVAMASRELGELLGVDHAYVRLRVDGSLGEAHAAWRADGCAPLTRQARELAPCTEASLRGFHGKHESFAVDDTATHPALASAACQRWVAECGARSLLTVEIVAEGESVGAITALAGSTRRWTARDVRIGEAVAADLGRALEHARLFAAQLAAVDHLQALDRAKDDFMSSVSHELRTPLTSISGYLELLEDDLDLDLGEAQGHSLVVIRRNCDRLRGLIEDLLTLSRIESGAFRTLFTDVDLTRTVEQVVEDLAAVASAAGVRLRTDVRARDVVVSGDASQLSRALLNVTSNAIKFTPRGGDVRLSVSTRPDPDGGNPGQVVLDVVDTGIGIPAQDQQALFRRFFRASNATSAGIPGTGLGLVIVRTIVENHGGTLTLRSDENSGTAVTMTLPLLPVGVAVA